MPNIDLLPITKVFLPEVLVTYFELTNHKIQAEELHFYFTEHNDLPKEYKDSLSSFKDWKQKEHAKDWLLYPQNIVERLSIDETAFTNGNLYTILSNKSARRKKGTLVAMVKGTKSDVIIELLKKIPEKLRLLVKEITLYLAGSMKLIAKKTFPKATMEIDRFHVQKLAFEAVQEIRIRHRWEAIDKENQAMQQAKENNQIHQSIICDNGESLKQLLSRSRYLLF